MLLKSIKDLIRVSLFGGAVYLHNVLHSTFCTVPYTKA